MDYTDVSIGLKNSYAARRDSIMSLTPPKIIDLKEKYPLLFNHLEIQNELDRVLSEGTSKRFLENIEMYAELILNWLGREDDPIFHMIRRKEKEFSSPVLRKHIVEVGSILILASVLNEDMHFLKLKNVPFEDTTFPYIDAETKLSGVFDNDRVFKVYAEENLICEATNFKEALLCLIACYYIFNIEYNNENFKTLVAIEKLYLEVNETDLDNIDTFTKQIMKVLLLKADKKLLEKY